MPNDVKRQTSDSSRSGADSHVVFASDDVDQPKWKIFREVSRVWRIKRLRLRITVNSGTIKENGKEHERADANTRDSREKLNRGFMFFRNDSHPTSI